MIRLFSVLFLVAALGGCLSAQEQAQRDAARLASMNAEDDHYCQSYGVEKGSPGYVACRNKLTEIRAAGAQVAASDQAAAGRAMTAAGAAMIQSAQPRPMTTCMPNGIGGVNCY
jgi:hypothetical protein